MPILMYFAVTGSALFASLFLAAAYVPPAPARIAKDIDRSIIRVHASPATSLASVQLIELRP